MKWLIFFTASLLVFLLLAFLAAEHAGLMDDGAISDALRAVRSRPGGAAWAAAVIVLWLAFDAILPVPSSLLMLMAGALLGWHWGWIASTVGAMSSALLCFGVCRRWGNPAFVRLTGRAETERITQVFERHGVWALLLSRGVPMLTELTSCLAGLSSMRFRLFFWVSFAGAWPLCVVYAWAGSRALDGSAPAWTVALGFAIPALGLLVFKRLTRRNRTVPRASTGQAIG